MPGRTKTARRTPGREARNRGLSGPALSGRRSITCLRGYASLERTLRPQAATGTARGQPTGGSLEETGESRS